jgi:hypothetical protein
VKVQDPAAASLVLAAIAISPGPITKQEILSFSIISTIF